MGATGNTGTKITEALLKAPKKLDQFKFFTDHRPSSGFGDSGSK
jgi:hypothetical protein